MSSVQCACECMRCVSDHCPIGSLRAFWQWFIVRVSFTHICLFSFVLSVVFSKSCPIFISFGQRRADLQSTGMQINHFALKTVTFVSPRDTVVLTRSTYSADGSVLVVSCSVDHAAAPKADRVRVECERGSLGGWVGVTVICYRLFVCWVIRRGWAK